MATAPFLLLPPSEGKEPGGSRTAGADSFARALAGERRTVAAALGRVAGSGRLTPTARTRAEKVFGARGDLLERALADARALAAGRAPRLPAWQRYTGVVWTHLDPATLPVAVRRRILVPSAVLGVTTAEDRIVDHRTKLTVRLDDIGNLARFWQPAVTDVLVAHCAGTTVVDLLPGEHAAAVDWPRLTDAASVVRVAFVARGGRAAGHDAKAVKGAFARTIALRGLGAVGRFRWNGWTARRDGAEVVVTAPG